MYVEKFPKILEDNPEAREIKPRSENYMSGVFKEVRAFFNWAYKNKLIDAFPFEGFEMPSERYASPIYLTLDDVFEKAGITYLVTELDALTRSCQQPYGPKNILRKYL